MEEAKQAIKELGKKIARHYKRIIQAIIVVIFLVILLAGSLYYVTVDDGTYKEDDWGNTPFAASEYKNSITVSGDGTFKNGMTAQELWDKMLKNHSRVDEYLKNPEELARLMRAEIVTKYPDTRPNPDEEIVWDDLIKDPDKMQGIIKFKRADNNGNKTTMSYVSPATFQGYIDEYNRTGSESAKQKALTSFTLKKASSATSNNNPNAVAAGDGVMTDISQVIIDATNRTAWPGAQLCAKWVDDVFDNAGVGACRHVSAYESFKHHGISTDMSAIPIGAAVYGTGSGSTGHWGHIGIYIGSGQVIDSQNGGIIVSSMEQWLSWQKDVIDGQQGWLGWGWEDNNRIRGTTEDPSVKEDSSKDKSKDKEKNKEEDKKDNKKDKDKKDSKKEENIQKATVTPVDGDGYSELYTSSAGITYKHYKQIEGSYAENSYWDGTIRSSGCGPTSVSILASGLKNPDYTPADIATEMNSVYGYTSYITLQQEMETLGMSCEVIQSPSGEVIQDNLRNGKVMLVSVGSSTIFTRNSHIMAIVDINEQGQVYICNPSSKTVQGWYDVSEITKGCDYIITTEAGAAGIASTSNTSAYTAVVATWRQKDTKVTSNDPNVGNYGSTEYSMTTTNINYEEMTDVYTMPFDMLWALLVVGEDKKFIFELIDLIYNSDIQITVHDNLTTNTDVDEWHYTQRQKADIDAKITAISNGNSATAQRQHTHDPHSEDKYVTTKTVITQTNTLNVALTKADVWIVDYENEFTYMGATAGESNSSKVTKPNEEYSELPTSTDSSYSCEHINSMKERLAKQVRTPSTPTNSTSSGRNSTTSGTMPTPVLPVTYREDITVKYYTKYINIYDNITNSTTTQKYLTGVPQIEEKTDKKSEEPNFVTIFRKNKYKKCKSRIKDAATWLFEIIEENESTADMLDLIKYLLYKATGHVYDDIDEFDFSIFKPGNFKSIGGGGNLNIDALTKTSLSEEEFVALVQGYSAAISKGSGTAEFRDNASVIYKVCVENNINPVFCAAQGWREQNWVAPNTSPHNYWGIAVYNGQNYGSSWPTMEAAVQAYCDQINSQATMSIYIEKAQRYATVDSRFKGDMSTIYDVFSAYAYIGDGHSLAEEANYVGDYIDSLSGIAAQIFGTGIM